MTCYNPLTGFLLINELTENGKQKIIFNDKEINGRPYQKIDLPCSQCIGCRIERARGWAIRCVHEASLFEQNSFITLTYNDDNVNKYGTLVKKDFQNFMKRLRKSDVGKERVINNKGQTIYPIRYFHCGEYGEELSRPHHHACLFNYDFGDKEYFKTKNGFKWFTSEKLQKLWPFGYHSIGDVTFESAAYIAGYVTKKVTGDKAKEHYKKTNPETGEVYTVIPEYITMSRRPGIGMSWYKQFSEDVFPKDFITEEGRKIKTPKYYDKLHEEFQPLEHNQVKQRRKIEASKNKNEKRTARLITKHKVKISQRKTKERTFENASTII